MTEFLAFPDVEAVVGGAIRNANLSGLERRVYSSVPKRPTYPLAVVTRLGGPGGERHYFDGARVQIDLWGTAKDTPPEERISLGDLHDLAAEARVVVFELEGSAVTDPVPAYVFGVEDSTRLARLPDPTTARDRYFFAVNVYLRTMEAVSS